MQNFARMAVNFLNRRKEQKNGLYASLEELMEQRKNLAYLQLKNKLETSDMSGEVRSAFKGRGIEMEEIREYTYGDNVRDIDWRVTARKKTPYTKIYAQERDREIYVLLDLSSSMVFGTKKELKSVTAAKTAALIGWLAQENHDRFGTVIYDGSQIHTFKSQHNSAYLLAILKKISDISQKILQKNQLPTENNNSLSRPLQTMNKLIKNRAAVFIVSDFFKFGDIEKKALATLSKKSQVFCIDIYDPLEETAPKKGEYMIENNGKTLVFDSRPQTFRKAYQNYFAEKKNKINEFCRRFNCRYMKIRTDNDVFYYLKFI